MGARPAARRGAGHARRRLPPVAAEPGEPTPPAAPLAVLSPRVAADMFWLGRYAERAEGTARLLRAVTDRWADFQDSPEPAGRHALETLLRATTAVTATAPGFLGAGAGRRLAEPGAELVSLITDRDREGTLAFAVHRLTAAAQAVREQLSTDTWLVLGRLDDGARRAGRDHPGVDRPVRRAVPGAGRAAGAGRAVRREPGPGLGLVPARRRSPDRARPARRAC